MTKYGHSLLLMKKEPDQKPTKIVCVDIDPIIYNDLSEKFKTYGPQTVHVNGSMMRYMVLEREIKDGETMDSPVTMVTNSVVNIPRKYFVAMAVIFEDKNSSTEQKYETFKKAIEEIGKEDKIEQEIKELNLTRAG